MYSAFCLQYKQQLLPAWNFIKNKFGKRASSFLIQAKLRIDTSSIFAQQTSLLVNVMP